MFSARTVCVYKIQADIKFYEWECKKNGRQWKTWDDAKNAQSTLYKERWTLWGVYLTTKPTTIAVEMLLLLLLLLHRIILILFYESKHSVWNTLWRCVCGSECLSSCEFSSFIAISSKQLLVVLFLSSHHTLYTLQSPDALCI